MPVRHHAVQVPATSANLGAGFDAFGVALDRHLAVRSVPATARDDRVTYLDATVDLPRGDDNLVWRSLVAFCERYDVAVPDVKLETRCQIPQERGLGSSSSAIVAGLTLARALTEVAVGEPELLKLATELEGHPDNVGPALLGGLVVCTVDDAGELLVRRVNPTARLRPVALVPSQRQATSAARAVLPETLSRADVAVQIGRAGHVLGALTGTWPVAVGAAGDRLHEPARVEVMGPSAQVLAAAREAGVHAWLSGAGPSVLAAVELVGDRSADALEAIAQQHGFTRVELRFDLSGAFACPEDACALAGGNGCLSCPDRKVDREPATGAAGTVGSLVGDAEAFR